MSEQEFSFYLRKYLEESRHDFYDERKAEERFKQQFMEEKSREFMAHIEKLFGSLKNKRILEVGSGTGWRSVAMAMAGANVFGIEPVTAGVEASILRAKRHPNTSTDFRVGVAERLPFADNSFDLVLSFQVIEHVQDVSLSLSEMRRVLRPGGAVYMETGNSNYPREEHYKIFWLPHTPKFIGKIYARIRGRSPEHLDNVNFMYKNSILKKMREAGFEQVRDLFENYVIEKFSNPERINSGRLRKMIAVIFKNRSLAAALGRIVAKVGIYPSLWLYGRK